MAIIYVRSTTGSDANDGSTWTLAKATLAGAAAIDAAGDTIYVSHVHAESGTNGALTFAGTAASPTRIICVNDGAEPPTAVASTATVTTTGANNIAITGCCYAYGIAFSAGTGSSSAHLTFASDSAGGAIQEYEACGFSIPTTSASSRMEIGCAGSSGATVGKVTWKSCTAKFGNASQGIGLLEGDFTWRGGSILSGSTALTTALFRSAATSDRPSSNLLVQGVDFTSIGAAASIFGVSSLARGIVRYCKLPASWTGTLTTGTLKAPHRFEMYNCDNADTNYKLWVEDYAGSIKDNETVYRTSGASDGTTPLSWIMSTSANSSYPLVKLNSPEMVVWNDTVGTPITVTVEVVHDTNVASGQGAGASSAFQDDEIYLSVQHLGTSGTPLGVFINDCKSSVLATATDQASSSAAWTTTGLTTPVKQALSVTFTPQKKGFIHAHVVMTKASKICYIDPMLVVT